MLSCAHQRHRTTNAVEGWHRRINAGRIPKKPNLHMFIYKLRKESKYWNNKISESLFSNIKKRNRQRKDIYFDRNYKKLLGKFERNQLTRSIHKKKIFILQMFK